MVEAQMARTMGNIGSKPGWASYGFSIEIVGGFGIINLAQL